MTITELERGMKALARRLQKRGYLVGLRAFRAGRPIGGWTGHQTASTVTITVEDPSKDDLYYSEEVEAEYYVRWSEVKEEILAEMRQEGINI